MSVTTDRDLADLRRSTEAAVLAAVKAAADRVTENRVPDVPDSSVSDLLTIVEAWSLVSGGRKTASPAALRG